MANSDQYLGDASSLITLFNQKTSVRKLSALVTSGRLRIPKRVAAELKRQPDKVNYWITSHPEIVILERSEHLRELDRILRTYSQELTSTPSAADPVIIAMALFFNGARVVLTDDAGIQIVCVRENLRFLPVQAFRRAEGI
jgi:Domain of unknown function (DUF4411)